MKTKNAIILSASLLAGIIVSTTNVSAATMTRDQIEAQGNQQIAAYWKEYQQALADRQNAWDQTHGNRFSDSYVKADSHAGAVYQEWLRAQSKLGDDLHAYDINQYQKQDQGQAVSKDDQQNTEKVNDHKQDTQSSQATEVKQVSQDKDTQSQEKPTEQVTAKSEASSFAATQKSESTQAQVTTKSDAINNDKVPAKVKADSKGSQALPQTGNHYSIAGVFGALLAGLVATLTGTWHKKTN